MTSSICPSKQRNIPPASYYSRAHSPCWCASLSWLQDWRRGFTYDTLTTRRPYACPGRWVTPRYPPTARYPFVTTQRHPLHSSSECVTGLRVVYTIDICSICRPTQCRAISQCKNWSCRRLRQLVGPNLWKRLYR